MPDKHLQLSSGELKKNVDHFDTHNLQIQLKHSCVILCNKTTSFIYIKKPAPTQSNEGSVNKVVG